MLKNNKRKDASSEGKMGDGDKEKGDSRKKKVNCKLEYKLYLDIINQVLLLQLFAREKISQNRRAGILFKKINELILLLSDEESFQAHYGYGDSELSSWLYGWYGNEEQSSSVGAFGSFDYGSKTFHEHLIEIYKKGCDVNRSLPNENDVVWRIVVDMFAYYDHHTDGFTDQYQQFLKELLGGGSGVKDLEGYSHHNLFMSLLRTKEILSNVLCICEEIHPKKQKAFSLEELKVLAERVEDTIFPLRLDESNFIRKQKHEVMKTTVKQGGEEKKYDFVVTLPEGYLQEAMGVSKVGEKNSELRDLLAHVANVFHEELLEKFGFKGQLPATGGELYLAAEYYMNDQNRYATERIVTYAGLKTFVQAILVWDFLDGHQKEDNAISNIKKAVANSCEILGLPVPQDERSVKQMYYKKIKKPIELKKYSLLQKRLSYHYDKVENRRDNVFFPYPLFF